MSIFSKLFGTENKNITTESFVEQKFETAVREAFKNNPMKGTVMEGIPIMGAIADTTTSLKNDLKANKINHSLSIEEIDELVDKIQTRIWNKYLK